MAMHIKPEHLDELEQKGRELFDLALAMSPQYTLMDADTAPEANDMAVRIQAIVLAINGLLTAAAQPEGVTIVGLGAACGLSLGRCVGDRRILLRGFKEQFSRALDEITHEMEPRGTA
jgi:hypothetical protein